MADNEHQTDLSDEEYNKIYTTKSKNYSTCQDLFKDFDCPGLTNVTRTCTTKNALPACIAPEGRYNLWKYASLSSMTFDIEPPSVIITTKKNVRKTLEFEINENYGKTQAKIDDYHVILTNTNTSIIHFNKTVNTKSLVFTNLTALNRYKLEVTSRSCFGENTSTLYEINADYIKLFWEKTSVTVVESEQFATLVVNSSTGNTVETVNCNVELSSVTAVAGRDYNNATIPVTILKGGANTQVKVPLVDQFLHTDGKRTFTAKLSCPNLTAETGEVTNKVVTVTVINDDVVIGWNFTKMVIKENSGCTDLRIVKSGNYIDEGTKHAITVQSDQGKSACQSCIKPLNETLTFKSNQTEKMVSLCVYDDKVAERNTTFTVKITTADKNIKLQPSFATITIDDNDKAVIGWKFTGKLVQEKSGCLSALLVRSQDETGLSRTVRVHTNKVSATPTNGSCNSSSCADYLSINQNVTFQSKETEKNITLCVYDDQLLENIEFFEVKIATDEPENVKIEPAVMVIFLLDDDQGKACFHFDNTRLIVQEEIGTVKYCVNKTGEHKFPVNVSVTVLEDAIRWTAEKGKDFTLGAVSNSVTLSFKPTDTALCSSVKIINDDQPESDEIFSLELRCIHGKTCCLTGTENSTVIIRIKDKQDMERYLENKDAQSQDQGDKNKDVFYLLIAGICVASVTLIVIIGMGCFFVRKINKTASVNMVPATIYG